MLISTEHGRSPRSEKIYATESIESTEPDAVLPVAVLDAHSGYSVVSQRMGVWCNEPQDPTRPLRSWITRLITLNTYVCRAHPRNVSVILGLGFSSVHPNILCKG